MQVLGFRVRVSGGLGSVLRTSPGVNLGAMAVRAGKQTKSSSSCTLP